MPGRRRVLVGLLVCVAAVVGVGHDRHDNDYLVASYLSGAKRGLIVLAHPDDELTLAAFAHRWARLGGQLTYLVLTDGAANPDTDLSVCHETDVSRCRQRFQKHALDLIGIEDVRYGGFADGQLDEYHSAATEWVLEQLATVQPDVVVTYGAAGFNGHDDHQAASSIVDLASRMDGVSIPVLQVTSPYPLRWFLEEVPGRKRRCLALHPNEMLFKAKLTRMFPSQKATLSDIMLGLPPEVFFFLVRHECFYEPIVPGDR